jgi:heavy metal sensor kinase
VALSLRARLTAWYSILLVLTVAVFSALVLFLHWRLLVHQFDESLESIAATADNVVKEEVGELKDLRLAALEMMELIKSEDATVMVLDESGEPLNPAAEAIPRPSQLPVAGASVAESTLRAPDGRQWRVSVRTGEADGRRYTILVGAPIERLVAEWRTLLTASLIGIPLVLTFAIGGGLWLGRLGLRPLTTMAAEAQEITATTPDRRLSVPPAGEELERLAHAFNRVFDRLHAALSTQRQFMADASHELRTPVSIMRTAADVTLAEPHREEAEYRDALVAVAQQSSRLTRLVDDMLVLARADGGGYPIIRAELDLDDVVGQCVRELAPRAEAKGIRLTSRLQPISMTADEALLRRMVGNLLTNALAYTPGGGAVDVTMTPKPGAVAIVVTDTGPGIPPEFRDRVFERFVRVDAARAEGGAGLGLAIARWVAEAHGGDVRIMSSGPDGSAFCATLPV